LRWYFERQPGGDELAILAWWEIRRIPYNLVLFAVGIPSFVLFLTFIVASGELEPGEDAVEPIALLAAPFLFNFCYTAGWVCEIGLTKVGLRETGPLLLRMGLALSLFLTLLPAALWGFVVVVQMLWP
jgi:hypothetical protein